MSELQNNIDGLVKAARSASRQLGVVSALQRTQALQAIAQEITRSLDDFLAANHEDVERAPGEHSFNGWRSPTNRFLAIPLSSTKGLSWNDIAIILGWA